jgi:hypothetical protein
MKKYKPKNEKRDIIRQLQALGVKVISQQYEIVSIECDSSQLQEVKSITKMDFEEVVE